MLTPNGSLPSLIKNSGELYQLFDSPYWAGYERVPIPGGNPGIRWKGAPIPLEKWTQLVAFFLWQFEETKGESQAVLYYHPTEDRWEPWVRTQERSSGMTTNELPEHPNRVDDNKKFKDWVIMGSVHHHCKSSAFQSGTDRSNEQDGGQMDGIHITLGKLDEEKMDFHVRVVRTTPAILGPQGEVLQPAATTQYEKNLVTLTDWFEIPEAVRAALSPQYHQAWVEFMLTLKPPQGTLFPERWKENLIEVKRSAAVTYIGPGFAAGTNYLTSEEKAKNFFAEEPDVLAAFGKYSSKTRLPFWKESCMGLIELFGYPYRMHKIIQVMERKNVANMDSADLHMRNTLMSLTWIYHNVSVKEIVSFLRGMQQNRECEAIQAMESYSQYANIK